jgi:F-box and leucine-rich repeat protein 10/11
MLPSQKDVLKISIKEWQTLIIPAGWIHAVYTPEDSVVFGGNFLHGLDIPKQLAVHHIEVRSRVGKKFRFPYFAPMHFYAAGMYLEKLRQGYIYEREVNGLPVLLDALEQW